MKRFNLRLSIIFGTSLSCLVVSRLSKNQRAREIVCLRLWVIVKSKLFWKMVEISSENVLAAQIKLIRKYLKLKIIEDNVSFRGHNQERSHVYDLMKRSIVNGESHSALMIGPRGCGKTTVCIIIHS